MDCARLAKNYSRCEHVDIVYRRTEAYMPASQDEYETVLWLKVSAYLSLLALYPMTARPSDVKWNWAITTLRPQVS